MQETFGLIKPEGVHLKKEILEKIISSGLTIAEIRELILTQTQFEKIYSSAKQKIPQVYDAMRDYMTSNQVILLRVSGKDAPARLLKLRGASNPCESKPGTIRGDYAKDQDYKILYEKREFAKNVFHAAEPSEANEMVEFFFWRQV